MVSAAKSQVRHSRHAAINAIVMHSLASIKVLSHLESSGGRFGGKRPDRAPIVQWKNGRVPVWNVTCVNTFAPSYTTMVSDGPGCIASRDEYLKKDKYSSIEATHYFVFIGIETSRVFGSEANCFLHELGFCLKNKSIDPRAYHFLLQRIAVAIQRGNAAAVLGSS